jgi:hypothetical protein
MVRGRYRLHGRINLAFFLLTAGALASLEVVSRWLSPAVFNYLKSDAALKHALAVHLGFSIPATEIRVSPILKIGNCAALLPFTTAGGSGYGQVDPPKCENPRKIGGFSYVLILANRRFRPLRHLSKSLL